MQTIVSGFELAPFQKRLWLLQQAGHTFTNQVRIRLEGELDSRGLKCALQTLLNRHEAFQTRYQAQPNILYPLQVVEPEAALFFGETDLSGYQSEEQSAKLEALLRIATVASSVGCLAHLIRLSENAHQLVIQMPALASDGQSLINLVNELREMVVAGSTPDEEPLPFSQYAEWHHELLLEADPDAVNFWRKQDFSQHLRTQLSIEVGDAPAPTNALSLARFTLPNETVRLLRQWALQRNMSPSALLFGCWKTLLWGYYGFAEEVVSGKVEDGRSFDVFASINGLLAKTLPVHARMHGTETMDELCRQLEATVESVRGWQDNFDWSLYQAEGNDPQRVPYFAACFEYTALQSPTEGQRTGFAIDHLSTCTDLFKLKLAIVEHPDRIEGQLQFQPSCFVEGSIQRLQAQYTHLIGQALILPNATLSELLSPDPEETHQLREVFNQTTAHYTSHQSLKDALEAQASITPQHPAVADDATQLTYAQLHASANQLAHFLINHCGIGTGDIVAVRMGRSVAMMVALLGIIKSGAAYLPVDPQAPEDRFGFILEDSGAKVVISEAHLSPAAQWQGTSVVLDDQLALLQDQPTHPPRGSVAASDPAYVIYTSGSTGQPKGVCIGNASLLNYLAWFKATFGVDHRDRTLLFSSIAFDLCYTSLWSSLVSGSTLCLLPETKLLSPEILADALIRHRVTYIKLTPSHFSLLAKDPNFTANAQKYALRLILLGGEEIKTDDVQKYRSIRPEVQFVNHYGPTETTIGVCTHSIPDQEAFDRFRRKPVIGKPIHNNRIYILNSQNRLLPVGMMGEICVSGQGLALGYLNREALSDEKFVANPYEPGQKMYRTGDLARWLPDGSIEFLGRKDNQVKVRGYRVELDEIESALLNHPDIQAAAVVLKTADDQEPQLTAYLVDGKHLSVADLRQYLGGRLPDYMIPALFVPMPALPLMPNGKVNRKALPDPKGLTMGSGVAYAAPRNEIEKQLVAIWQKVLGVTQVGIDDNFFDLGGNSLKLVGMLGALTDIFPGKVVLTDLFKYNTISSITGQLAGTHEPTSIDIVEV